MFVPLDSRFFVMLSGGAKRRSRSTDGGPPMKRVCVHLGYGRIFAAYDSWPVHPYVVFHDVNDDW